MDLRYSVPFNHKKHKEASAYDVKPLVLPTINTDECDGDEENSTEFNEENEGAASGPDNVDGVASKCVCVFRVCVCVRVFRARVCVRACTSVHLNECV